MSGRKSRHEIFIDDVKAATQHCSEHSWEFTDIHTSDQGLNFAWRRKTTRNFTLCVTEDYPENTVLTDLEASHDPTFYSGSVLNILTRLREVMMASEDTENHKQDGQDMEEDTEECYSDADVMSDDFDDDTDYYADNNMFEEPEHCYSENKALNPLLLEDMACYEKMFGPDHLGTRHLESIQEIDLDLQIPITFLQESIASAWSLNYQEPITVRLHMNSVAYLDSGCPPTVEVFQASKKEKVCVLQQLKKILEKFAMEAWHRHGMCNNLVIQQKEKAASDKQQQQLQQEASCPGAEAACDDMALSQMVEMGIDHGVAVHCLLESKGNVPVAVNMALGMDALEFEAAPPQPKAPQQPKAGPKPKPGPKSKTQPKAWSHSTDSTSKSQGDQQKAEDGFLGNWMSKTVKGLKPEGRQDGKSSLPSENVPLSKDDQAVLEIQEPPSLQYGFLVQVALYVQKRLLTLNEFCVVCDCPHIFSRRAILKPAVCARELCVFSFQTLGVMVDAANDIAVGQEVIALLLALTKFAAKSERRERILDPYPTVVDPGNPKELAITPQKKDFDFINTVLNHLKMDEMLEWHGMELKKNLDERHRVAYPLLQWIIASNRSHIELLPSDHQLPFMNTKHQFLLMSSPPAKEAKFLAAKAKFGSVFAFHGSCIENWHGIIREGLVIASGTSKQVNGAAYGRGIYLSPLISISINYCINRYPTFNSSRGNKGKKNQDKKVDTLDNYRNMACIALCEVINCPDALKQHNDIWVCSNPDFVCTRFFFVYVNGIDLSTGSVHIPDFKNEVIKALQYKL